MSVQSEHLHLVRGGELPTRAPAAGRKDSPARTRPSIAQAVDECAGAERLMRCGRTEPCFVGLSPSPAADHRVKRAVEMMKAAPSQSAHEVAARLKLSTSRLRHLFKQGVGAPLGHYLKHLRLHRAKRLIETSRFTLARVMSEVGETDESHFRRDFKKHFGVPPAECRAAARGATVAAEKDDEPA